MFIKFCNAMLILLLHITTNREAFTPPAVWCTQEKTVAERSLAAPDRCKYYILFTLMEQKVNILNSKIISSRLEGWDRREKRRRRRREGEKEILEAATTLGFNRRRK